MSQAVLSHIASAIDKQDKQAELTEAPLELL